VASLLREIFLGIEDGRGAGQNLFGK